MGELNVESHTILPLRVCHPTGTCMYVVTFVGSGLKEGKNYLLVA